ncbi:MAG: tyrosine-type recombinase/integrase [Oscillospiraceae bacterium]|nr:tyrosine-type recombinase/integrase [Oscillospiraceae bacterium]
MPNSAIKYSIRVSRLRHTYAVNAIRAGDDLKTIQGNLGHATAEFTMNVYAHFTEELKTASASRMDSFARQVLEDK